MEQNVNNKIEIKDKLKNFYNKNKFKIYTIVFVLISVFFVFIIYKVNLQKKNELISENYIKAGLYLNSGKKKESLDIYEKIILSGNKFYSILALSIILEKNLITDQKIILDYFLIVKEKVKSNNFEKQHKISIMMELYKHNPKDRKRKHSTGHTHV